jgi:hypothetical protein
MLRARALRYSTLRRRCCMAAGCRGRRRPPPPPRLRHTVMPSRRRNSAVAKQAVPAATASGTSKSSTAEDAPAVTEQPPAQQPAGPAGPAGPAAAAKRLSKRDVQAFLAVLAMVALLWWLTSWAYSAPTVGTTSVHLRLFVINLARRPDRMKIWQQQYNHSAKALMSLHSARDFQSFTLSFERVPGVDGKAAMNAGGELPQGEEASFSLYENWVIPDAPNEYWRRKMTPGEIGCALSHMQAVSRVSEYFDDQCGASEIGTITVGQETGEARLVSLVMEDDAKFDATSLLGTVHDALKLDAVDPSWDMFYPGSFNHKPDKGFVRGKYAGFVYGAFSMVFSRHGAAKLSRLEPLLRHHMTPADEYINALAGSHPRKDMLKVHNSMLATVSDASVGTNAVGTNTGPYYSLGVQLLLRRLSVRFLASHFLRVYHSPTDRISHHTDSGRSDVEHGTAIVEGRRIRIEKTSESWVRSDGKVSRAYLTLTTIPERLTSTWFHQNLQRLLQLDGNFSVQLNVPHKFSKTGEDFMIPKAIASLQSANLRVYRVETDFGPLTKLFGALLNDEVRFCCCCY